MGIEPVRRSSISDQVYEQIKNQIVNGEWKPGTKIPSENQLVKMLNASRITIREALQKLTILGLVETYRGDGTYVKELSPGMCMNSLIPAIALDNIGAIQVLEFRRVIEVETVGLAVDRASKEDIDKLYEIFNNMKKYKEDTKKFAEEDSNFHIAIAEITKNPLIIKVNYIIKDILNETMENIVNVLGDDDGIYYHEKIIKAIEDKDREKAKKIMEEHIIRTIERLSKSGKL